MQFSIGPPKCWIDSEPFEMFLRFIKLQIVFVTTLTFQGQISKINSMILKPPWNFTSTWFYKIVKYTENVG